MTSVGALTVELRQIRERGYAVDDQENDPGIVCLAVPVYLTTPARPSGAVSVSAPVFRTPLADLVAEVEVVRAVVTPTPGVT